MENYILVHNGSAIILAEKHDEDLAVATTHTVLIDTFENLVSVLTILNIDAQPLHSAKEDYERHQAQLNQNQN